MNVLGCERLTFSFKPLSSLGLGFARSYVLWKSRTCPSPTLHRDDLMTFRLLGCASTLVTLGWVCKRMGMSLDDGTHGTKSKDGPIWTESRVFHVPSSRHLHSCPVAKSTSSCHNIHSAWKRILTIFCKQLVGSGSEGAQQALEEVYHKVI